MKRKIIYSILFIFLLILTILILLSSRLMVTHYTHESNRIPKSFDGYKIVHLSDIHCKSFGKNNSKLIDTINNLEPDLILITGDNVDKAHPDITPLANLFAGIYQTAPIYSVSGNHECDNPDRYAELISLYKKFNIIDLDDKTTYISVGDEQIMLKGLGAFENKIVWDKNFIENNNTETFSILLDHYPQLKKLAYQGYDLLLCGHIHGGVIRIPFLGGLINNDGTFFPEYDAGRYTMGKTSMYISRGLGDTAIPRINNRPEVVCITLRHKES